MSEASSGPWTVLRLLQWTTEYFERAEVDPPRLAAEVLLASVLNCPRIQLYARFGFVPAPDVLGRYRELVRRAAGHEPVAYLVGTKEFYSLPFQVNRHVMVPRPETEILVSEAVRHLRRLGRPGRMWDVCTGSGCVAVAVAVQVRDVAVLATDVSPEALALAEANARANGVGDRVRFCRADLLDLPDGCGDWAGLDAITANPPYVAEGDEVAEEVKHEPPAAIYAGPDGLDCIRRIVPAAPRVLAPAGVLALEFGLGQADAVRDLICAAGAFGEPRIVRDQQGIERVAVAVRTG